MPIKNPELPHEKLDFNDLLKKEGVDSVIDHVSGLFPGGLTSLLSPRDSQKDDNEERLPTLSGNQASAHGDQHGAPTKHLHVQDESVEKDTPVFDWESVRKADLLKDQYDLVISHRDNNGKPSNAFREQYAKNPEQALHTVTLYDPSVIPVLEKAHFESLMKPCVVDGQIDKEATLKRQYHLIIDYKNKFDKSTENIETHFKERPGTAIRIQMACDRNIANMLDPKVSSEEALKFLDPPALEKELDPAVSAEEQGISAENDKEIDSENAAEDSHDKHRSQGLSL